MKASRELAFGLALVLFGFRLLAGEQILTVAVFDFESKDGGVRDLGPKVATIVVIAGGDFPCEPLTRTFPPSRN